MLYYFNSGVKRFKGNCEPESIRQLWEFFVCLDGVMSATVAGSDKGGWHTNSMWVFPSQISHGWKTRGPIDRVVMQFTEVAAELTQHIPPCGFYRIPLSPEDCIKIRQLAETATQLYKHPTPISPLRERNIMIELCLMALHEADRSNSPTMSNARITTERALVWFGEHMSERPSFVDIARAVYVSPTHLRRIIKKVTGQSPHKAIDRLRMERVKSLLSDPALTLDVIAERVGLSSAAYLSRAFKAHTGVNPSHYRRRYFKTHS